MRHKVPGMPLQLLGQHVTTALQVWLWLLLFVFQNEFKISRSSVPGYLDFDNLPDTNFSCAGKVIGGYYADVETSCQMFHVCTIGQQDEPMDIKFLCLNGTVFDQETRVCERVDEVDCSKTEKFYSLNLELYGNTAPPIVEENHEKDEENHELPEDDYEDTEVAFIETTTTTTQQPTSTSTSSPSTTKQPTTRNSYLPSRNSSPASTIYNHDNDDFEQHDGEIDGYYINGHKFLQNHPTHENNNMQPNMESLNHGPSPHQFHSDLSQNTHKYNNPETTSGYNIPNHSSMKHPNNPEQPHGFVNNHKNSHDPSQKTEAISFQHQVFPNSGHNPPITVTTHNSEDNMHNDNEMTQDNSDVTYANKIYITTSTPEVEKRKPESYQSIVPLRKPSNQQQAPTIHPILNQPKPNFNNPVVHFNLRNPPLVPQGFKPSQPTQNPPPSQIQSPAQGQRGQNKFATNRPIQSFQPSENHEILIDASFKLPEGPPLGQHDYSPYHFEPSKRSHDQALRANKADDDILKAEIKATDQEQEEWTPKRHIPKSPPKVIITASASVSDSNGKKLNYTVGNVVHAVQSIVPVNYDDYKESDIISDPFFLDVPKIKRKRTRRQERYSTNKRLSKRSVVFETHESNSKNSTPFSGNKDLFVIDTHFEFNSTSKSFEPIINNHHSASYDQKKYIPLDYVDDNYEPIIYREVITNRNDIKNITDNKTDVNKTTHTNKPNKKEENEAYIKEMENRLLREVLIIHGNRKKEKLGDKVFQEDKKIEYSRIFNITTIPPFVSMTNATNTASDTTKNNIVNYSLTKVQIELLNGQTKNISETFSCKNRTFHIPYAGINDCKVFHLCSPGYNKQQVVNLMYQCDTGTYFNIGSSLCMEKKPNECKH